MHMGDPERKLGLEIELRTWKKNCYRKGKSDFNKLVEAEGFEKYLHIKFVGTKRLGLDGAEALIPALEQIIKEEV